MGWFRSTTKGRAGREPTFEERLTQISPGVPGRCPTCDGLGYIDSIDIAHRYQIQHCKDCQQRWEYLFDGDGRVVGVTELDEAGRPVSRSRVRTEGTAPTSPAPPVIDLTDAAPSDEGDVVVDLRDAAEDDAVVDLTGPDGLTPAEWLRQSRDR